MFIWYESCDRNCCLATYLHRRNEKCLLILLTQVPVISWFDDPNDTELLDLLPFLEAIAKSDNVYSVLSSQGFTTHAKQTAARVQQLQQQQCPPQVQCHSDEADDDDVEGDSSERWGLFRISVKVLSLKI